MSFEDIEKYTEETLGRLTSESNRNILDTLCFRRGIEVDDKTLESKIKDLKLWMSISNLRNVPDSLLLFSRITDFTEDLFELESSDDEYEILKASSSEVYASEKIREFEKTFGIDDLLQTGRISNAPAKRRFEIHPRPFQRCPSIAGDN